MEVSNRYCNSFVKWLDEFSFLLMNPLLSTSSRFLSCYISTIYEKQHPQTKLVDYFVCGPLYGLFMILFFPFGLIGILMWILICESTEQKKFTFVSHKEYGYASVKRVASSDTSVKRVASSDIDDIYTLASINVLLAPEIVARLNNIKNSYARTLQIAERILRHTGKPLTNLTNKDEDEIQTKYTSVLSEFPELDFLCLQEVWERNYALMLIEALKEEFFYYVYDVGEYSLQKNYCMLGSGLFFASKKPILDVDFFTFTFRTKHAKLTTQGVLCVKVLLHYEENGECHVGYIANIHTQAFQGTDAVLLSQLTDILIFTSMFKEQKTQPGDVVDFDIICGDFNSDNMSPGDSAALKQEETTDEVSRQEKNSHYLQLLVPQFLMMSMSSYSSKLNEKILFIHLNSNLHTFHNSRSKHDALDPDLEMQQHCLFEEYQDICVENIGKDVDWAIGTELRQSMLCRPDIESPEHFREILIDDSLRRQYVLDADVLIHSTHLMTSMASPGPEGYIEPLPCGGKRRVDKILYRGNTNEIIGYGFLSALTNLTDHLPVCMSVRPRVR